LNEIEKKNRENVVSKEIVGRDTKSVGPLRLRTRQKTKKDEDRIGLNHSFYSISHSPSRASILCLSRERIFFIVRLAASYLQLELTAGSSDGPARIPPLLADHNQLTDWHGFC
jgi:hypothetical protein